MLFTGVVFICIIFQVNSLILRGSLETDKTWKFVGKFCFQTSGGKVDYTIAYSMKYAYTNFLFYYDDQWPLVYPNKDDISCNDKEVILKSEQIYKMRTSNSECDYDSIDKSGIVCNGSRSIVNARPRWWYVVFSRCSPENNTSDGIQLDYEFHFTNGNGTFIEHFSADEIGIFETSIALFLVYTIIFIITVIFARILTIKRLFHTTFKIFLVAISFEYLSVLFTMSEYAQYSSNGIFTQGVGLMGRLFDAIAQTAFLLLLILLAKGYTVTRGKLRTVTVIKIIIMFCIYVSAYIIAFCYSEALFDPGLVNYFYSSPGGLAVIILKIVLGWTWFCYGIIFTIKNYPEKRKFYYALSIFYSIWFWAGPIIIIITNYAIAQHVREKVGFIIQSFIIFIGYLYFLILTFPSKINDNFPYHVSTNHIGVIKDHNETENYGHHKDNEGGNKYFDNPISLQNLFLAENAGKRYQIDETRDPN